MDETRTRRTDSHLPNRGSDPSEGWENELKNWVELAEESLDGAVYALGTSSQYEVGMARLIQAKRRIDLAIEAMSKGMGNG